MPAEPSFDENIHALTRLRLCSILRPVGSAEFSALRDDLQVSEANLSKTVRNLAQLGYLATSKERTLDGADARLRTRVSLTPDGRRALDGHLAALRELAVEPSEGSGEGG